jgi:hypothetical protein
MVSAVSKATEDTTETISLAEAVRVDAPLGGLFHARCTLAASTVNAVRLTDVDVSVTMQIEQEKSATAKHLIGNEIVATVLRRTDGNWRALALRSPSEFDRWYRTRGDGDSVDRMYEDHRETIDRLRGTFSA